MKTTRILIMAMCGALTGSGPFSLAGQTANSQSPGSTADASSPETSGATTVTSWDARNDSANNAPKLGWGLNDIAKLSKAGVDESVILTYIRSSGVGYNPSAQDLIQLRELGVSSQITTALMQRGGEVRQQAAMEAQKQVQAAAPTAAPAPATTAAEPATVYAAPAYTAPVSTVTYIGYPSSSYTYGYGGYYSPIYYSYPYYPRYYGGNCFPRVSFGVSFGGGYYGGSHSSYNGGSHSGSYGGFHGASHGGSGHHR